MDCCHVDCCYGGVGTWELVYPRVKGNGKTLRWWTAAGFEHGECIQTPVCLQIVGRGEPSRRWLRKCCNPDYLIRYEGLYQRSTSFHSATPTSWPVMTQVKVKVKVKRVTTCAELRRI